MSKKSVVQRNINRAKKISQYAQKRAALKKQIKNQELSLKERFALVQKLHSMKRDSSPVRYRKRCSITQRGNGLVDKDLGISRIMMRELVAKGYLPGVRKASW